MSIDDLLEGGTNRPSPTTSYSIEDMEKHMPGIVEYILGKVKVMVTTTSDERYAQAQPYQDRLYWLYRMAKPIFPVIHVYSRFYLM